MDTLPRNITLRRSRFGRLGRPVNMRKLAAARELLGYSLDEVAAIIGVLSGTMRALEAGRGTGCYRGRKVLGRYLLWIHEEAAAQGERRRRAWVAEFEAAALCPEDNFAEQFKQRAMEARKGAADV